MTDYHEETPKLYNIPGSFKSSHNITITPIEQKAGLMLQPNSAIYSTAQHTRNNSVNVKMHRFTS